MPNLRNFDHASGDNASDDDADLPTGAQVLAQKNRANADAGVDNTRPPRGRPGQSRAPAVDSDGNVIPVPQLPDPTPDPTPSPPAGQVTPLAWAGVFGFMVVCAAVAIFSGGVLGAVALAAAVAVLAVACVATLTASLAAGPLGGAVRAVHALAKAGAALLGGKPGDALKILAAVPVADWLALAVVVALLYWLARKRWMRDSNAMHGKG